MKHLLIKFPSRERPERFFAALDNIRSLIGYPHYHVLCSFDYDDHSMNNDEVKAELKKYPHVISVFWKSSSKVEAINRDMEKAQKWDIGILMSDDMYWLEYGWGETIVNDFESLFPDGDGVLHYPDGHAKDKVITMSIMDKKYYNRDKYWYNPIYKSVYCDNEFMEVSMRRGRYAFLNKELFEHRHPAWGLAVNDDLYLRNESSQLYIPDQITFANRKAENFGL